MSENLSNRFELFPFHLVGKFSHTEAKYLFLTPMYSAILTAILKAWLLNVTSLCPLIFQHVDFVRSVTCLVILELHKYSNNLSIIASAAPTEVQGILQEEFPRKQPFPSQRIEELKYLTSLSKLECCCVCSEVILWQIASKSLIDLYYLAVAVERKF